MIAILFPKSWQTADRLSFWALITAVAGVLIAWQTLRRSNLNSSVATASGLTMDIQVALNEYINSLPSCLSQMTTTQQQQATERLETLMNRLEMASAICVEKSLAGISLTIVRNYIKDVISLIIKNQYTCTEAGNLLHNEKTFKYIRWFMGIAPPGSITTPPGWYEKYEPTIYERIRVFMGWPTS